MTTPLTRDTNADINVLVENLTAGDGTIPELIVMEGWLGPGSATTWRIYTHLAMSRYCEVDKDDVWWVHAPVEATSPSYVWLRAEASITHVTIGDIDDYVDLPGADDVSLLQSVGIGVNPTQCPRPCRSR